MGSSADIKSLFGVHVNNNIVKSSNLESEKLRKKETFSL